MCLFTHVVVYYPERTSEHWVNYLRRPAPMKVLVEKMFKFVELVWSVYISDNKPDIRYISCITLCTYQFYVVFRPIEDEEPSDTDGEEVEDGTALCDAESLMHLPSGSLWVMVHVLARLSTSL